MDPIVPNAYLPLTSLVAPLLVLLISYIWVGHRRDQHHAFLGFLQAFALAFLTTQFLKWAVGGLRPNFLAVCKPNLALVTTPEIGTGYYTPRQICTGNFGHTFSSDESTIADALRGFPSGHAAFSTATFCFVAFYLSGKLKPFDKYGHVWKSKYYDNSFNFYFSSY